MTVTGTEARRGAALEADIVALERLAAAMKDGKDGDARTDDGAMRAGDPPAPAPGDPIPPDPAPAPPLPEPPPPPTATAAEIEAAEETLSTALAAELAGIDALLHEIDAARAAAGVPMPPDAPPGAPPGDLPPMPLPDPMPDPGPGPLPGPMPDPGPDQTPGPALGPEMEPTLAAPDPSVLEAELAVIAAEVAALKLRLATMATGTTAAAEPPAAARRDPLAEIAAITAWVEALAHHWPAHQEPPKALKTLVFGAGLVRGMLPPDSLSGTHPTAAPRAEGVGAGAVPPVTPTAAAAGRAAESPAAIPAGGWRRIAARTWDQIWEDRVLAVAAGVAFYALLSLFPAITALVSVFGLFADRAIVLANLAQLDYLLPPSAIELIRIQLDALLATDPATLTFATVFGLALALWTANGGMKAMIEALNVAYGERERRSFLQLNAWSLTMTIGGIGMVILLLGLSAALPSVLARLPTTFATDRIMLVLRWPAMLGLLLFVLSVLYRFGPSREDAKWRWVSPGALTAAALLIAASAGFSFYTANFASYDATYGSLGAVVALMMWAWIAAAVVLLGAEINSEAERQTARDTTTGRPQPMGARGAFSADTLGE
ncbi:YihY/virulence factor BrkB family protein [Frigidibacter sp. MR17.14]|uniref:YihY/virulence factor BrkB family protein n=1 Tax=Frigidibacter sp. MR17.14 TaxID=3126509 RepID=UPI003012C9A0